MRKGIDIIKQVKEKLGKSADAGDYIDDFKKSDAPQFKGKSDKKKEKMAVAAYLDSKEEVEIKEMDLLITTKDDRTSVEVQKFLQSLASGKYKSELRGVEVIEPKKILQMFDMSANVVPFKVKKELEKKFRNNIKVVMEEVKEEKRQLKDPKKEAMVMKVKDSGSIMVIDKKDLEKYLSKGYIQVEDNALSELKANDPMSKSYLYLTKPITVQYTYIKNPIGFAKTLKNTKTGKALKTVYPIKMGSGEYVLKGTGQQHIEFLKTLNNKGIMPKNKIVKEETDIQEARLPSFKDLVKYKYGDDHAGAIHFSKIGGKEYHWNYVGRKGGKYFVDNKPTPEIRVSRAGADYKINKVVKEETDIQESGHTDVASMKTQVQIATDALQKMNTELGKLSDEEDLPTWWTNKVASAVGKLDGMADYIDAKHQQGDKMNEAPRQLEDPKKETMVMKKKDVKSIMVIDKKDLQKYTSKGYIQVESNDVELNIESLDKEDEKSVKKVIKGLKKAVDAHSGQVKSLTKDIKDEVDNITEETVFVVRFEKEGMRFATPFHDMKNAKAGEKILKKSSGVSNISITKDLLKPGIKLSTQEGIIVKEENLEVSEVQEVDNSIMARTTRLISQTAIKEKLDPADVDVRATDLDRKAADKNIFIQLKRAQDMNGKTDVEFLDKKKQKVDIRVINKALDMFDKMKPNDKLKMQLAIGKSYRDLLKVVQRGKV